VYSAPNENEEILHQSIFYACQTIRNLTGTTQMVPQSMIKM
jgi:hypothetical protein